MHTETKKVKIISHQPTGIIVKYDGSDREVKMSKQFFRKRLKEGHIEVINKDQLPTVI